jgi:hypothetical protein
MFRWLPLTVALWLFASSGAQAQMKGLGALDIAEVAKNHTLDLRISPDAAPGRPQLVSSMLVHRELGPGASVGLGLANMYRKRRGGDFRPGDPPVRSRKPAVTFEMKF